MSKLTDLSIGDHAFMSCKNLEEIIMPVSLYSASDWQQGYRGIHAFDEIASNSTIYVKTDSVKEVLTPITNQYYWKDGCYNPDTTEIIVDPSKY